MKIKKNIFIPLFLFVLHLHGFSKIQGSTIKHSDSSDENKSVKYEVSVSVPDKILIKSNNEEKLESWSKNMPWIGAIIIGLLTVAGNVLISSQSRKANAIVAEKQIQQLKLNSERDFNKTVLSGSRQLWISDFREVISELLSIVSIFSLKQHMEQESLNRLHLLVAKAELMLTTEKEHLRLVEQLLLLKNCCSDIMMEKKEIEVLEAEVLAVKTQTVLVLHKENEKAYRGM